MHFRVLIKGARTHAINRDHAQMVEHDCTQYICILCVKMTHAPQGKVEEVSRLSIQSCATSYKNTIANVRNRTYIHTYTHTYKRNTGTIK